MIFKYTMRIVATAAAYAFVGNAGAASAPPAAASMPTIGSCIATGATAPHRGVYEVRIQTETLLSEPFAEGACQVIFRRPDGASVEVDAFYDGVTSGRHVFKARAYCDQIGDWLWTASLESDERSGGFTVTPSDLPGKLRKHPDDPHQFAYDNGAWFLHIGDTGYRYLADTEPEWQAYVDQAAKMGATKIRTWFCRSRGGVEALFTEGRDALNLPYWQEMDRRLQYALNKHPRLIFQLIPYGEDTEELLRYAAGDSMARIVAQYAQARFSAFPNVTWCISNDRILVADSEDAGGRRVPASVIDQIARDMAGREAWGTLLTNHQARGSGYDFVNAPWSDIITIEDIDQVHGEIILTYRQQSGDPVVNDEDRYEIYRPPAYPRYFFRRLMWASLFSGGHATYGGARTYEPYNGRDSGVRGYYDLRKEGILTGGADDFTQIHAFFQEANFTLAGMRPSDAMAGGDPRAAKVMAGERNIAVYLPNPDSDTPEKANAAGSPAACQLQLPLGRWAIRWFNPGAGDWHDAEQLEQTDEGKRLTLTAPFAGDAVLIATAAD